jgi:hypothetical protein
VGNVIRVTGSRKNAVNWWQRLLNRAELEQQLDAELRHRRDHLVADYVAAGMSEDEARRKARLEQLSIEKELYLQFTPQEAGIIWAAGGLDLTMDAMRKLDAATAAAK